MCGDAGAGNPKATRCNDLVGEASLQRRRSAVLTYATMKQGGSKRTRRPVVVFLCAVIRIGRRVRTTCAPHARGAQRWMARVAREVGAAGVETHIIVAVVSSAAFAIGGAWSGVGTSELCKLAGAVVVGALAVSAASTLIRRQLGHQPHELRAVLAGAALTVLRHHTGLPAARVLRVALTQQRSPAAASVNIALAALTPPLEALHDPKLLGLALRPALRLVPAVGVALDAHGAYLDCLESARFVRAFAQTAAALCPPAERAPALCA